MKILRPVLKPPLALALLLLLPAVGGPTAVQAEDFAPPQARQVMLEKLATASPGPEPESFASSTALDTTTNRAFTVDDLKHRVMVFDTSGPAFRLLATIAGTFSVPGESAIDEAAQRLYVLERAAPESVVTIDIDPASPTAYRVIASTPTGGTAGNAIAVDPGRSTVYVANSGSDDVSVVGVSTGRSHRVTTGREPTDVVVDPVSHTAYVSSASDEDITVISDGVATRHRIVVSTYRMALFPGGLAMSVRNPYPHLEIWDPESWEPVATSDALGALPTGLAVDPELKLVYAATKDGNGSGVTSFSLDALRRERTVDDGDYTTLTVDLASHRLVATYFYVARTGGLLVMLQPRVSPLPSVERIDGADRYAVSAQASAATFASGVPVAYVASGAVFPDALSGSAAAGREGGPVLLVTRDSIPPAVRDELARLRPQRIVLLGGELTVSAGVLEGLRAYSGSVTRVGGEDRYAVSAATSRSVFPANTEYAYIASGVEFPDALSGSAGAGHDGAPVLLVQKDSVPAVVTAEIARLNPRFLIVVGGPATVADSVLTALSGRPVYRIDGPDRFAVSAAVSERSFPPSQYTVFLASGSVFPDALSASAAAIASNAPVMLITRDGIPAAVAAELRRLKPYRIVVLGGRDTVPDPVLNELEQYLPD